LGRIGIHFKASKKGKPLGEEFVSQKGPISEVSAGTGEHEMTTGVALDAILAFFMSKLT